MDLSHAMAAVPAQSPSPRPEDSGGDDSGNLSDSSEDLGDDSDRGADSECEALDYNREAGGTLSGGTHSVDDTCDDEMAASVLAYEEVVASVAYLKKELRLQYPLSPKHEQLASLIRGLDSARAL